MGRNISNREVKAGHTPADTKPDTEPDLPRATALPGPRLGRKRLSNTPQL